MTTVGATQNFAPEVAVNLSIGGFFSGGGRSLSLADSSRFHDRAQSFTFMSYFEGFSNYFLRPPYQFADVESYLAQHVGNEYEGLYNPFGKPFARTSVREIELRVFTLISKAVPILMSQPRGRSRLLSSIWPLYSHP